MNVPKLRFKEFNDEWAKNYVGNVAGIYLGVTYTPDYVKSGKIFISSKDISKGYLDLNDIKYISEDEYNKISTNAKPVKGDVLFTRVGSNLGNPTVIETNLPLTIFVSLGYLRVNKNLLDNYFIKYWMESNYFWQQVDSKVAGGAKQNLNIGWLSKFDIKFPKIVEQKKIANTLELLDKKIELQTKKIEDLKLFKKGINQKIFSKKGKMMNINEYIEEYTNKTIINNQYPILSSTSNGIVVQNEYFNKQTASLDNKGYKIVPRNYITYRSMSDTGEFHFNEQNKVDIGIVSPAYPVFKINGINSNYFLNYINESSDFKMQIMSIKEGGTRFALSFNKFKNLKIKIVDNIETYGNLIECMNKYILIEKRKLVELNKLKTALLQNMFV
mgnify:CR=1 FL=1